MKKEITILLLVICGLLLLLGLVLASIYKEKTINCNKEIDSLKSREKQVQLNYTNALIQLDSIQKVLDEKDELIEILNNELKFYGK
jgi:peptidoglycan hydrolase CwlO-like protein